MAVFRVEKTKDFTIMCNHHLRNTELSLKAKGLLSLMLSLPEDWDYTTKGLAHICKDGVDSITTALKELERHGYLTRQRLRYENGQLGDILAGDFLRESEFNLRSLATNTGPDSIAIMGKNHIWLADALSAYYPTGELYRMAAMTEYPGARAFLFHTERKEDGRLYGDVLMTDLDTLRQDIERNTLYPYGVNMEYAVVQSAV